MNFEAQKRVNLTHTPTRIELLKNLSKKLGGPKLYIKRDDCTGLATGGNKARKLEYLLADALEKDTDIILTVGGIQSNHVRQTVAAAAICGLASEVFLEPVAGAPDAHYQHSGNVFLDRLMGAKVNILDMGVDLEQIVSQRVEALKKEGRKPYVIPLGGSNVLGSLGYVQCMKEIHRYIKEEEVSFDAILHATGSAGTQAGLLAGSALFDVKVPIHGICVSRSSEEQGRLVHTLTKEVFSFLGLNDCELEAQIHTDGAYVGEGYGIPTPEMIEAVELMARTEGILLDPVYTGKGMAGLIDRVRKGFYTKEESILFIHTGGSAGLFAYEDTFYQR